VVRFPAGTRDITLHSVQTECRAHLASYTMGAGGSFPGVTQQGREADHLP
jgi:hypothetical protein